MKKSTLASPAERWRAIVQRHRDSGLSVAEFCRRQNLPPSSFFGWRRRCEPRVPSPAFVEVTPAAIEATLPEAEPLEVRLGDWHILVWRGFDRQSLRELVGVLEALR
jgi:transposase-like protein